MRPLKFKHLAITTWPPLENFHSHHLSETVLETNYNHFIFIPTPLPFQWWISWLTCSTYTTDGEESDLVQVMSGVPQEAVLNLLMFLLYADLISRNIFQVSAYLLMTALFI